MVSDHWAGDSFDMKWNLIDKEQESVVQRLMNYTNKNPWLWGVYVVVIGLPLVLIVSCCCSSSEREEKARRAARKKTDEPEDDGVEDLDLEEVENADEDDKEASPVEDDDQGVDTAEKEDGSDADEAGEQVAEESSDKSSPRRRRATRKD